MNNEFPPASPSFDRASGTSDGLPASVIDVNAVSGAAKACICGEGRQWRTNSVPARAFLPAALKTGGVARHADPALFRVLVACEYSATVRDAFRARGFDAWSCDLLPTEGDPRWHIQGDAIEVARRDPWDLLIAHPPCTHLAVSGARHFAEKIADGRQAEALGFVADLFSAPIKHVALENPISIISSRFRKPDQIIQPWQFGHGETKATCLWLNNLPKLVPTNIVDGRADRIHKMPPGPNRWKERSRTYQGVADAMAGQWGNYLLATAKDVA